jgi:hypothetical protein
VGFESNRGCVIAIEFRSCQKACVVPFALLKVEDLLLEPKSIDAPTLPNPQASIYNAVPAPRCERGSSARRRRAGGGETCCDGFAFSELS